MGLAVKEFRYDAKQEGRQELQFLKGFVLNPCSLCGHSSTAKEKYEPHIEERVYAPAQVTAS